jgi:hypothetical protein
LDEECLCSFLQVASVQSRLSVEGMRCAPTEGAGVYFGRGTFRWRKVVGEKGASRSSRGRPGRVLCTSGELRLARAKRKLVEYWVVEVDVESKGIRHVAGPAVVL